MCRLGHGTVHDATFAGRRPDRDQSGCRRRISRRSRQPSRRVPNSSATSNYSRVRCQPEQKVLAITGSNGKTTVTALTGALVPRRGSCRRRRRQHRRRRCSTNVAARTPALARRLRARVVEFPARNDVLADRRSPRQCSTSPTTISTATPASTPTRRPRRASFANGGIQVAEPRRPAFRRHGHRRTAPCRRSVQACPIGRKNGASSIAARGATDCRKPGWHAAALLLLPASDLALVGRHNALNALAALALASTVARDRPPRARRACVIRGSAAPDAEDRRGGRRAVRRRFQGHDRSRDARGARTASTGRSC